MYALNKEVVKTKLAEVRETRKDALRKLDDSCLLVDCASYLFALSEEKIQGKFKFTIVFNDVPRADILNLAAECALMDYPCFSVRLKKRWNEPRFERNYNDLPIVAVETDGNIGDKFDNVGSADFPFIIKVCGNEVVFEFEHYVTDGTGGWIFVKRIIKHYESLCKTGDVTQEPMCDNPESYADDAFSDFVKVKRDKSDKQIMTGVNSELYKKVKLSANAITTDEVYDVKKLIDAAKRYNTTVNTLILAVSLRSLIDINGAKKTKKPYTLFTPVNARKLMGSDTLRNYTFFCRIMIKDNDPSLETIIKAIDQALKEQMTKESMQKKVSFSSMAVRSKVVKYLPFFIKSLAVSLNNIFVLPRTITYIVSNMGRVDLVCDMVKDVRYNSIGNYISHVLSVISYGDSLNIGYQRLVDDTKLIDAIDKNLRKL